MGHRLEKGTRLAREQARGDRKRRDHGIVENKLMNGRVAGEMTEARKEATRAPRAANPICTVTRTKEAMGVEGKARARAKARVKPDTATTAEWDSVPEGEKAEELTNLETRGDGGEWCWPRRNGITRWEKRVDPRPAFLYLTEDDEGEQASGGLNHLVSRNAGGAQWTWKTVTVVADSGAAENVMPRSMFPEIRHQTNGEVQAWKRVQRSRRREHQEVRAASHVRQDP